MLKRKRKLPKQHKPAAGSRRRLMMQDVRRKILRRSTTYFLTQASFE
ncbi:hypothetical protein [Oceanimonas baumannii]|uniref:Uncharacterized protein n=1 Tax=Oceanimonas baumannii TaxID=129578 RepID=A0ABY2F2N1_9GAMM|nr:hypothetical protein [Oceanimonas baumannii]TDW62114.1 hypothetical protein LY04_00165 [Oceanimonas baumannii]